MADTQIRGLGTGSAPLSYTVPGAQEIILKSLFAAFDGTGAAGSFLPCVRILAPGGGVVGEYITDTAVAAGSSAEVSFAPFLRRAPVSVAGSVEVDKNGVAVGTEPIIDFEDSGSVTWTVTDNPGLTRVEVSASAAGGGGSPAWAVFTRESNQSIPNIALTTITSTAFATSDTSVFSSTPGGVAGDTTLSLSGRGLYLAVGIIDYQTLGTYEHSGYVDVSPVLDAVPTWAANWAGMLNLANTLANATTGPVATPNSTLLNSVDVRPIVASDTVTLPIAVTLKTQQWSGVNKNVQGRLAVLYWPGTLTQTVVY